MISFFGPQIDGSSNHRSRDSDFWQDGVRGIKAISHTMMLNVRNLPVKLWALCRNLLAISHTAEAIGAAATLFSTQNHDVFIVIVIVVVANIIFTLSLIHI